MSNIGTTFRNSKWTSYTLKNTSNEDRRNYTHSLLHWSKLTILLIAGWYLGFYLLEIFIPQITTFTGSDHLELTIHSQNYLREAIPVIWHYLTRIFIELLFNYFYGDGSVSVPRIIFAILNNPNINSRDLHRGETLTTSPTTGSKREGVGLLRDKRSENFPITTLYKVVASGIQYNRPNLAPHTDWEYYRICSKLIIYGPSYKETEDLKVVHHYDKINQWLPSHGKFVKISHRELSGLFYLNTLNYQTLNNFNFVPELQLSTLNVLNQSNVSKILRWSYRYSLLHRKTLVNSHKLTASKKLLGPGFFDSTSTKTNLWFSDTFSREGDSKLSTPLKSIATYWNMMYRVNLLYPDKNLLGGKSFKDLGDNFDLLDYYESSFHFFIKRADSFLQLEANPVTLMYDVNTDKEVISNSTLSTNLSLLSSILGRSHTLASQGLNPYYNRKLNDHLSVPQPQINCQKDLILPSWRCSFLTVDHLGTCLNTANDYTTSPTSVNFFELTFEQHYEVSDTLSFCPESSNDDLADYSAHGKAHITLFQFFADENQLLRDAYLLTLLLSKK